MSETSEVVVEPVVEVPVEATPVVSAPVEVAAVADDTARPWHGSANPLESLYLWVKAELAKR